MFCQTLLTPCWINTCHLTFPLSVSVTQRYASFFWTLGPKACEGFFVLSVVGIKRVASSSSCWEKHIQWLNIMSMSEVCTSCPHSRIGSNMIQTRRTMIHGDSKSSWHHLDNQLTFRNAILPKIWYVQKLINFCEIPASRPSYMVVGDQKMPVTGSHRPMSPIAIALRNIAIEKTTIENQTLRCANLAFGCGVNEYCKLTDVSTTKSNK